MVYSCACIASTIPTLMAAIPFVMILCGIEQKFSKQIDPATGYFYYENITTGERHWDRPLDVVLPLQPKSPSRDDEVVNEA